MKSGERGIALLETLIALSIILLAGLSVITRLESASRAVSDTLEREERVREAARVMTAMSLLTATDLDRRLGRRPVGEFIVHLERPEHSLYRIAVSDADSPELALLVTVVYRPAPIEVPAP